MLFFVGTAVAAVMAAIQSAGGRAKIFWAAAVAFAVMGFCYYRWSDSKSLTSVLFAIWGMGPLIALWGAFIYVSGWQRVKEKPSKIFSPPPVLNPALTPKYLNDIVNSSTSLEASNRISAHSNQLMKAVAQIYEVKDGFLSSRPVAELLGLHKKYGQNARNSLSVTFKANQRDALAAVKRGDWIELVGRPIHEGHVGWSMTDCEFIGLANPPQDAVSRPKAVRKPSKPKA
ncbi:hypothetical protein [uncultured Caulobacter sp.]|uniref:hypothetical protein n=1 Tax=uncultured Caulobacter sp. TaxID=158749 RepID=UPI00260D160B|nr:hypothetical protein [uncultured Caulobacter sp.]